MISITRWTQLAMALYGKQKILLVGPAASGSPAFQGFFHNPGNIQLASAMFENGLGQGLKGAVVGQYPGFTAVDNH